LSDMEESDALSNVELTFEGEIMETRKRQPKTTGLRRRNQQQTETQQPEEEANTPEELKQEATTPRRRSSKAAESTKEPLVSSDAEISTPVSEQDSAAVERVACQAADVASKEEYSTSAATELVSLEEESAEEKPRFHYFIIDAGWKSHSARVLRENFHMIREFENHDVLYVLTREQSIDLIRANPVLIGKDPILLVHDLHAKGGRGSSGYHGFRLCLGVIKNPEQALQALQEFLRFISDHRKSANIENDLKRRLHREGMEGAIEVIREGASEMMA